MISDVEKKLAGIIPMPNTPAGWDDSIRPNWIDLSLNFNNAPCQYDTAIIVTSWWGHLPFLEATLKNYRLTGKFIICAYDSPFKAWSGKENYLPTQKMFLLPHSWVFKHVTYDGEKREGWFWDIRYAQGIMSKFDNFKYIFHVNGDSIWTIPDGVDKLIEELGDADFMSASRDNTIVHTCAILYKAEAFHKVFDYLFNKFKVSIIGSYSPEKSLLEAVNTLKLKEKVAPKQPMELDGSSVDHYSRYNQDSTWKEIVGFRNLSAETMTCLIERTEPVDKEYIDLDLMKKVFKGYSDSLGQYYVTGDRRWLLKAWEENEESWYDRLAYPLEHYGDNPIYGDKPVFAKET